MASGSKINLLVILGPTASGKSALAMKVAEMVPSEVIAADSRTIYEGMDIGTAKASLADRERVRHWGIDIVKPDENYSVKQFQDYAKKKIKEIRGRGNLPILVGGTGLYIDSVIYNFSFVDVASDYDRGELNAKTIEELQEIIKTLGYDLPENLTNKRHLVRQIERGGRKGQKSALRKGTYIVGLMPRDQEIKEVIARRASLAFKQGVLDETKLLTEKYGEQNVAQTGILYKICIQILSGKMTEDEGRVQAQTQEWQYARRQRTWFKRNPDIVWFSNKNEALAHLRNVLNT